MDLFPLRQFHDNRHGRNATYSPLSSNQANHYLFLPPTSSNLSTPFNIPQHENNDLHEALDNTLLIDKPLSRNLRFEIILEAATAVTQRAEETTITYLNRGQTYGILLNDKNTQNEIISSTVSIGFHSTSHRRIAENYWKFWINQQKQENPRAIDIDINQSEGITELHFPSFDKISFKWNGRFGAKLFVRFNCLSTDFSRIKGVKGIPLRAQMESHVAGDSILARPEINEVCFCKVKLFRDKGAERKNKDDAKQISKQLEKVYGKADEKSLPLMYNVSLPCSVFNEIPGASASDSPDSTLDELPQKRIPRYHTRIMTAPAPSLFHRHQNNSLFQMKEEGYEYLQQKMITSLPAIDTNNIYSSDLSDTKETVFLHNPLSPPLTAETIYTPSAIIQPLEHNYSTCSLAASSLHELSVHQTIEDQEPLIGYSTEPNSQFDMPFTSQVMSQSIYDVFTPEEIQQCQEIYPVTTEYPSSEDYFYHTDQLHHPNTEMMMLQQQLQQHNQKASHIILNSNAASDMLLSSPARKKRRSNSKLNAGKIIKPVVIKESRQDVHNKRRHKMLRFILVQNRQGKTRLAKWYVPYEDEEKVKLKGEVHRLIAPRDQKNQSNFVEYRNYKIVYRRYAGLFFCVCVDANDNELAYLEAIHFFVEVLDAFFGNVCELDLVFNFYKVYAILDEVFLAGEIEETSKNVVLTRLDHLDKLE
ncbi:AP-2 complex subunit sigma [Choanephora cucurbitarum]|uniref:AP-2 complex subunit sigma n=1 Tax=Choanephora cucurbitarum TaxID=101091 RepID=A0A1C7MY84_9FUNG|nr:AP-2 complex subunit sigma [Choanephora cucurbitarum]